MLRKKLRKRETYMRDWSTALGGEGGSKKEIVSENIPAAGWLLRAKQ